MATRIGLSIPFGLFTEAKKGAKEFIDAFGGEEAFLDFCADNVDSTELRMVACDADPRVVLNAVKVLKSKGLWVTIHGTLGEDFFAPYRELFAAGLQESYNITVHPLATAEATEKMLREICGEIESCGYPVMIALENQRLKRDKFYGTCADVEEIARKISSRHLELCFDFGHQLTNERAETEPAPSGEFLTRVVHTHIHSLAERTHYPLTVGDCTLDRNITELLSRGYEGVMNLELSPARYVGEYDVKSSIEGSVAILKAAVHQVTARLAGKDFYRNRYLDKMREAREAFDTSDDCAMLVGASAYVLKLHGKRIAIDVTPRIMPIDDSARCFLLEWISDFDAHIVTHEHGDHYDPAFISELPASVKKIIPDFLPLKTEGRVTVTDGSEIMLGDAKLKFYTSGHFLGTHGVPEYGIAIETDGDTLLFPTDVRDYGFVFPKFERVRALFSHLWLGRGTALKFDELFVDGFCSYVAQFNAERCYVAHLVETSRDITNMWSDIHLDLVREHLPDIIAPEIGEIIDLSAKKA